MSRLTAEWQGERWPVSAEKCRTKYGRMAEYLVNYRDALPTFYDFHGEHWDHLRTINPIESVALSKRIEQSRGDHLLGCHYVDSAVTARTMTRDADLTQMEESLDAFGKIWGPSARGNYDSAQSHQLGPQPRRRTDVSVDAATQWSYLLRLYWRLAQLARHFAREVQTFAPLSTSNVGN